MLNKPLKLKEEPKNLLLVGKAFYGEGKCYYSSGATSERGNATYKIEFLDATHVKVTIGYDDKSYTATKAALLEKCTFSFDGTNLEVKFCPEDGNHYSSNANVATWYFTVDAGLTTLTPTSNSQVPCIETDTSYLYFVPKAPLNLL